MRILFVCNPLHGHLNPMLPLARAAGADDPALLGRIERLPHARSVFVTLGTVYSGNTAALAAAIEGLRDLAVNLIVAVGPQGDPSLFEGSAKDVLVERRFRWPACWRGAAPWCRKAARG
jgi:UDP:flavonoid glycosyltransferase YjiC (YdhE family)